MAIDLSQTDLSPDVSGDTSDAAPDATDPMFDGDPCASGVIWEDAGDGPFQGRDHHATFITTRGTPTLHVVGGTNYTTMFADHWVATILPDGGLSEWRESTALPNPRAGQSVISTGTDVWLISGRAQRFETTTYRAQFDDAGEITGWSEEESTPLARFHSAGVHDGTTVWMTGGIDDTGLAQSSMFRAQMTDGEIVGWDELELATPRSHHATFAWNGDVYLALGFSGNPFQNQTVPHDDVVRFPNTVEGPIIQTETVSTFADDISTMSMTVTGECVRSFGGLTFQENDVIYQSRSWKLSLSSPESGFIQQAPMNTGRSHMHQVPYYNGVFYAVGGSIAYQDVTSAVEIGRL